MQRTKIEYLTHTWNPLAMRCSPVSDGCKNCWHMRMANRLAGMDSFPSDVLSAYRGGKPVIRKDELTAPFKLKKPAIIGVQFMGDLFHNSVSYSNIAAIFGVMAATPQHQYVVLTKRPYSAHRCLEFFSSNEWGPSVECSDQLLVAVDHDGPIACKYGPAPDAEWPLKNVILGVSVEDQKSAIARVHVLLSIPASLRCVSVEPMIGPTDLSKWLFPIEYTGVEDNGIAETRPGEPLIDLVICGAETGPGKRPFKNKWALDLRDQCRAAGVPFFFKQDGDGNKTLCCVEYHEWLEG